MSREEQSSLLRRGSPPAPEPPAANVSGRRDPVARAPRASSPEAASADGGFTVVKKTRTTLTVEQTFEHGGAGRPLVRARVRLTTAVTGRRSPAGAHEEGVSLRLEILEATAGLAVEGLALGPWQAESLNVAAGGIWLAPTLWSGFQPQAAAAAGRILLADHRRQALLDLPWKTEILLPGAEPL